MASHITLDTILSSQSFFSRRWTPDLTQSQARDLLRFLTIRLYSEGKGQLQAGTLTISQSALGAKLGITREWCNKLLGRLKESGWITYTSSYEAPCKRTPCTFTIGNTMRRLLVMLAKSHAKKAKQKQDVNSPSPSFPLSSGKRAFSYPQAPAKPLSEAILSQIPLLKRWCQRGKEGNSVKA